MIDIKRIRSMCSEPAEMIEGYADAIADTATTWHCHHRLETDGGVAVSKNDLIARGLYFNRPASELVLMHPAAHVRLHATLDKKRYEKSSVSLRAFYATEKGEELKTQKRNRWTGKPLSSEVRCKISKAKKGIRPSLETRSKMSEAAKGRPGFWTGQKMGDELRMRLSTTKLKMAAEYNAYKAAGGSLLWKQWQHEEWPKIKTRASL